MLIKETEGYFWLYLFLKPGNVRGWLQFSARWLKPWSWGWVQNLEFTALNQERWTAQTIVIACNEWCSVCMFLCFYMGGRVVLTGMVWLPWRALIADWASVCVENLTKAQPGRENRCTPHTHTHTHTRVNLKSESKLLKDAESYLT